MMERTPCLSEMTIDSGIVTNKMLAKLRAMFLPSRSFIVPALVLLAILSSGAFAGQAEVDWKALVALDAGPEAAPQSPAEARKVALNHLEKQEKALRRFLAAYPTDARAVEARLRLARTLQLRADVQDAKIVSAEVDKLISEAEKLAKPNQQADVHFARLSYQMRAMREPTPEQRQRLLDAARSFQRTHPSDRRLALLLTEVATVFDLQPKTKHALLLSAQSQATDEDLKARIADDLRRVEMVGQPVSLNFTPPEGTPINVADYRGKAVIVIFFAAFSPPAIEAVLNLKKASAEFPADKVQIVGISLDTKREPLEQMVVEQKITWPIICDGKGWESPLVRSYGINALPTAWLLDAAGRLKSLNALTTTAAQVKDALDPRK
jgi:peroxiredoxin